MRTSLDEINRAYLKFYSNPDTLIKVKSEPTQELQNRVNTGKIDAPILVNSQIQIKQEQLTIRSRLYLVKKFSLLFDCPGEAAPAFAWALARWWPEHVCGGALFLNLNV